MTSSDTSDVRIEWHRHDTDRQVIVNVDSGEVQIAVAIPVDVHPKTVADTLTELERELDHYYGTNEDTLSSRLHG